MGWKILILAYCGGSYMATTALVTTTEAHVLSILQQITGTDQVQRDLDLPLFERHVLDSLGMVELMIQLSEEFGVDISPADAGFPFHSSANTDSTAPKGKQLVS